MTEADTSATNASAINNSATNNSAINKTATDSNATGDNWSLAASMAKIKQHVVGRERELELALAAVAAGRDLVLEGPPGTSKTTMLSAITKEWGIPLLFVEGNADLTPAKLVGHHNPARVLKEDYSPENFVPGPLLEAMQQGGFLYIEEFNRAPEDTLNTLLTAMADRSITVPRMGRVEALPTFRVVASMNPYDNIGTTRLSMSVHDRLNRIYIDYQDEPQEIEIVRLRAGLNDLLKNVAESEDLAEKITIDAVAVTRATREHDFIRQGSSVRGAIDTAMIAGQLIGLRDIKSAPDTEDEIKEYNELFYDAMIVGLSGRIHIDESVEYTPEQMLREIWEDHFILAPNQTDPG
ncbi:MAG TPA: MoxR family ATPase [Microbacteriaceae bacterium]|nr:MoxR family ATPase [Microbacteriaceae bacterium]